MTLANNSQTVNATSHPNQPAISQGELFAHMWEFDDRKKRKDSLTVRGTNSANEAKFNETFKEVSQFLTGSPITPESIHYNNPERTMLRVKIMKIGTSY